MIGRFGLTPVGRASEGVGRTADAPSALVQDVRGNHGRPNVLVAEQFLHGADVVPVGQQVRGEGMPGRGLVGKQAQGQSTLLRAGTHNRTL